MDVAVVGQDPRFGGGSQAQQDAFLRAARELGRQPVLHYPSLARSFRTRRTADGRRYAAPLPELNAATIVMSSGAIARAVRHARSVWTVSAVAPYGYGATRARQPYACWIATDLESEWAARRSSLPLTRRLALRGNARALLRLERRVLSEATAVYTISATSRDRLAAAASLSPARVRVLPLPVDVDRLQPEPDDSWLGRLEQPLLVFVGRSSDPRKNVGLLLRAFEQIRRRVPGARLRLVGEPPSAATRLPDGVEVVGNVESVVDYVRPASLFVLPSLQEGFGIVAAEALACGVPVLSTPCGGPEELLRESGGGRILGGFDAGELADQAVELLEDAVSLSAMRRRGRDYVVREHSPASLRALLATALKELDHRD